MKKLILSILVTILISTSIGVSTSYAQGIEPPEEKTTTTTNTNTPDTLKETTFSIGDNLSIKGKDGEDEQTYFKQKNPIVALITGLINFAVRIIGSLAVLVLIVSGFMFMFAQGDQTKIDEAKELVKYAITGLAVALLSYVIVIFVQSIFIAGA